MDWFLYDNGLRHERVKLIIATESSTIQILCTLPLMTLSYSA